MTRLGHSVGKSLKKVSISQCAKSQSNIFGAFMNKKKWNFWYEERQKKNLIMPGKNIDQVMSQVMNFLESQNISETPSATFYFSILRNIIPRQI